MGKLGKISSDKRWAQYNAGNNFSYHRRLADLFTEKAKQTRSEDDRDDLQEQNGQRIGQIMIIGFFELLPGGSAYLRNKMSDFSCLETGTFPDNKVDDAGKNGDSDNIEKQVLVLSHQKRFTVSVTIISMLSI
jgi:hypothetical protein